MTRILITGAAGFVGSTLIKQWGEHGAGHHLIAIDNFSRPGSEYNRTELRRYGVEVIHADVRMPSDLEGLPDADWVVDAAANPAVLAGTDGRTSPRQLLENNLSGTVNLLEYCRARGAGALLLSTSRVYSLGALSAIPIVDGEKAFQLGDPGTVTGLSAHGISEAFSTTVPRSLYGTSKAASEDIALEYAEAFGVRVFVNRCGVLAGAGQFARPDQGIFAYWIHSWAARRPLAYLGFTGTGHQVRDVLHPRDLVPLLDRQMQHTGPAPALVNVSGGIASACSLRQCSEWCAARLGPHQVAPRGEPRRFDVPWLVLDNREAQRHWGWAPATSREAIFEEIAAFAAEHPEWLDRSAS